MELNKDVQAGLRIIAFVKLMKEILQKTNTEKKIKENPKKSHLEI